MSTSKRHQQSARTTKSATLPTSREIDWFRRRLIKWFATNRRDFPWRKSSATNYAKIVSEVLLQRTRAEVIAGFLPRFLKRFPSWEALAKGERRQLAIFLKPIGLWKRRSVSLDKLAKTMAATKGRFPRIREEIEELPNVGQYITNAILLFVHREREPLLDSNMARVLERFFGPRQMADIRYDPYLQSLSRAVLARNDPVLVNWALLDHAALVCKIVRPRCGECPLASRCAFFRTHNPNELQKAT